MEGPDYLPPVGTEAPLPPEHSLPSYGEPTPETHRSISREEEAELALTRTECTPPVRWLITALFLLTIAALPALNFAARYRHGHHERRSPGAEVLALLPTTAQLQEVHGLSGIPSLLPTAGEIKQAEKNLEKDSIVSQFLLPRVQSFLTGTLHVGNEQAYPGRDGWLFYRADVDHVTGPPFLDPQRLRLRARELGIAPDPVAAIIAFRDQLQTRGIQLVVLPVPVKPAIEGEKLSARSPSGTVLRNPSLSDFRRLLGQAGVRCLDLEEKMAGWKKEDPGSPLYLETDTHWRPETMQRVARLVAEELRPLLPEAASSSNFAIQEKAVRELGDIATMLKLPAQQKIYEPQTVTIQQVQAGDGLWRPDPGGEVLLLGDSFSNIYALAGMGWGESAGLAEHLSLAFGRSVDTILRNSDGAFATREILSRELARGHDRLAGKKVVLWEFAERELSSGDWKALPMILGTPPPAQFLALAETEERVVQATVAAVSRVPRPGSVPYRDHIFSVHLEEISGGSDSPGHNVQAIAYLWSMRDNCWTPAASLRPGDHVGIRLSSWPGAHSEREQYNRSELPDPSLELEEHVWGELVEAK